MSHAHRRDNLVIITSEPLTKDVTDWFADESGQSLFTVNNTRVPIPQNHIIIVTQDSHVFLSAIGEKDPLLSTSIKYLTGLHC